jgi:Protein of unknown function (DUF4058)
MRSPFPGMNPFLETPYHWQPFHTMYLASLQRLLSTTLPPGFISRPEQRVYIVPDEREIRPDAIVFATAPNPARVSSSVAIATRQTPPERVLRPTQEITERFIEIRDIRSGSKEVITVIELLSPANKELGSAERSEYLRKQQFILTSSTHLIEIDLLRGGEPTVYVPDFVLKNQGDYDYVVTLASAAEPQEYIFWRNTLQDSLPVIMIPLTEDIPAVQLDLQVVFDECWEANRLDADMDYTAPLQPSLSQADALWVEERLLLGTD